MSPRTLWLDDWEIDWSGFAPPSAASSRRSPTSRHAARSRVRRHWAVGLALLGAVLVATIAIAIGPSHAEHGGGNSATAPAPAAGVSSGAGSGGGNWLDGIAHCESRGNTAAVSPDGQYRGKYQFDAATWQSVGGRGDPAAAPVHEQDRRARALAARRGSDPWPICGPATFGR